MLTNLYLVYFQPVTLVCNEYSKDAAHPTNIDILLSCPAHLSITNKQLPSANATKRSPSKTRKKKKKRVRGCGTRIHHHRAARSYHNEAPRGVRALHTLLSRRLSADYDRQVSLPCQREKSGSTYPIRVLSRERTFISRDEIISTLSLSRFQRTGD